MDNHPIQNSFSVILISPTESRNVGSVARAMSNLGFSDLRIVSPHNYSQEDAAITACGGESLLHALKIYETLEQAVADLDSIVGFSARAGKNRAHPTLLPDWSKTLTLTEKTGLLFGTERTGLTNEEISFCHEVLMIPASKENPSFNLAQAVLIALYEITTRETPAELREQKSSTSAEYEQLHKLILEAAKGAEFLRAGTPAHMEESLRSIFRRSSLDSRDMQI